MKTARIYYVMASTLILFSSTALAGKKSFVGYASNGSFGITGNTSMTSTGVGATGGGLEFSGPRATGGDPKSKLVVDAKILPVALMAHQKTDANGKSEMEYSVQGSFGSLSVSRILGDQCGVTIGAGGKILGYEVSKADSDKTHKSRVEHDVRVQTGIACIDASGVVVALQPFVGVGLLSHETGAGELGSQVGAQLLVASKESALVIEAARKKGIDDPLNRTGATLEVRTRLGQQGYVGIDGQIFQTDSTKVDSADSRDNILGGKIGISVGGAF